MSMHVRLILLTADCWLYSMQGCWLSPDDCADFGNACTSEMATTAPHTLVLANI